MKLVLIKEGNVYRSEAGQLPAGVPERMLVDVSEAGETQVIETWGPGFNPDLASRLNTFLKQTKENESYTQALFRF